MNADFDLQEELKKLPHAAKTTIKIHFFSSPPLSVDHKIHLL